MSYKLNQVGNLEWLPLLVPNMPSPQELLPWMERMHASKQYSNFGPLVCELEDIFAKRFGQPTEFLTTVANATQGLELVLQALRLPPKSRVLVPTFTFVATITAVLRAGHIPVLADVDADCWLLTPDIARSSCAQTNVDAVLPVATFGMPHDMQEWQKFEADTGLPVVIDAAAAYGSQWLDGAQGTLVFSLHTTKSLPAGEGALVVSTRPGLAERVRQLSNFGINLKSEKDIPIGALADTGTNAKMSEYHAAVGLYSLQKWESNALARKNLHADLIQQLNQASDFIFHWQTSRKPEKHIVAPTLLCPRLPSLAARDALEVACQKEKIMTRRWYQPLLHEMDVLKPMCQVLDTPNAQALSNTLLGLPFFVGMTREQSKRLVRVVAEVFGN